MPAHYERKKILEDIFSSGEQSCCTVSFLPLELDLRLSFN